MNTSDREKWLVQRRNGIGGSDAAAVCGMSPWATPLDVYIDKIGESESTENQAMRRGTLLEPVVRQMYADETGTVVAESGTILRSERYPWAMANLDGIPVGHEIVVECKTARDRRDWGEPWSTEIPIAYLFQVQHYMAVMEFPVAHVAVLFGTDFEFAIYEVPADPEFQALMMEREAAFWELVQSRTPPDPINDADVSKRWPISKPIGRVAKTDELELAAQLLAIKEKFKQLEGLKESLEAEMKRAMEDAEALSFGKETICTWKSAKGRTGFDTKRFQIDHPDLFVQYKTESASSRRFLLKENAKCLTIMKPMLGENWLPSRELLAGS